jgi:hypothetical protein
LVFAVQRIPEKFGISGRSRNVKKADRDNGWGNFTAKMLRVVVCDARKEIADLIAGTSAEGLSGTALDAARLGLPQRFDIARAVESEISIDFILEFIEGETDSLDICGQIDLCSASPPSIRKRAIPKARKLPGRR